MLSRLRRKVFPLTLSSALDVVCRKSSESTRKWYGIPIRDLIGHLGDVPVAEVTPEMLADWYAHLTRRQSRQHNTALSPWTINSYLRAVRSYFNKLVETGHLDESPAAGLRLPKLPRKAPKEIGHDDIQAMLRHAKYNRRDHAMVRVLADTGCRVGGLVSMRASSLDIARKEDGRLRGRAIVVEKGQSYRYVFFGHETCQALIDYLEIRPYDSPDELWLSQMGGTPLTESGVYQTLKRIAKRAGVKRFNPHAFRHAFAKRLIKNGADPGAVSRLMGHESGTAFTMDYYVVYTEAELEEQHEIFAHLE